MFNHKEKVKNLRVLNSYTLNKTLRMFLYSGLPETIPQKELEKILQNKGYAFITEVNGSLYALSGSLSGIHDAYGNPTEITVSNPYLNVSENFKLDEGVLIYSDSLGMGLKPFLDRINTYLLENEISLYMTGINSRLQHVISAPDDKTKQSAEAMLSKLKGGELAVIGENTLFDGVRVQGGSSHSNKSTDLIEVQQYWKAYLLNEVGISSNFNMKRERLNTSEVEQSEDSLFPLVYDMLYSREEALEELNEKYGLSVSVEMGSVWKAKNEIKPMVEEPENEEDETGVVVGAGNESGGLPEETHTETDREEEKEQLITMLQEEGLSEEDKQTIQELLEELKNG